MLDSSSWTSPYILPKLIKLKTKIEFNSEWMIPSISECICPICQCCKWHMVYGIFCTFFQSAHFLCVRFHFLIEQRYFGWTNVCSERYFWWLNWYGGSLLSHTFMRLCFAIHFVIPIEATPILLFRWTWFTVRLRIFYKTKKEYLYLVLSSSISILRM